MFDRTKVDNGTHELGTLTAEVVLDDGRSLGGRFVVPTTKSLFEALNGPGGFIEFEPLGGERQILAKASLKTVRQVSAPEVRSLAARLRDLDGFDPHTILGVKAGATWDEVRHAYLALSKRYHPDRYASAELPPEVADYLAAMVRRVNAAFSLLEGARQEVRVAAGKRSEPIYESRPRF